MNSETTTQGNLVTSFIRTLVPITLGILAHYGVENGLLGLDSYALSETISIWFSFIWYTVFRLLESKGFRWAGIFLGKPTEPDYVA